MDGNGNGQNQPERREQTRVLIFGASLRAESLNVKLAQLAARSIERHGAQCDLASMAEFDCPGYNGDVEAAQGLPKGADNLCKRLEKADAFIIASPEYNASMPGILKNVIDWGSRLRPQPFDEKHGLLMSASPSMMGGNRGLWALRIPLEHLGARIFPSMFSLAQAHKAFDASGGIADPQLAVRFDATIKAFLDLVEAAKHYACIKQAWYEFLGEQVTEETARVDR